MSYISQKYAKFTPVAPEMALFFPPPWSTVELLVFYLINSHQLVVPVLANSAAALQGLSAARTPVHVLTPGGSELKEFP